MMENYSTINISFPFQVQQLPNYWNNFHELSNTKLISFPSITSTLVSVFLLFISPILLAKILLKVQNKRAPLPPGPKSWPVIGNLPEIWRNKPAFRWILGLMKQLDIEIACIRLGNVHVIPVMSPEIAREFLKKHDSIFPSRPITMGSEIASRGFLATIFSPWGDQWRKMRKVLSSHIISPATLSWLLHKRTQEADNLIKFIYSQCMNNPANTTIVNLRLATRQYTGNVIRKMMFNKRYFGEVRKDGGPGHEEEEHVESIFTVLAHLYSFILSDYVPWLRPLDLEGHEKIITNALRTIDGYHDPIIDERLQMWREGKREKPEDLVDAFILLKDSNGKPLLSVEEIKAQCTVSFFD